MDHSFWKQASGRRWVGTEWWDGKELDELWNGDAPKKADLTEEEMMEALNEGTSERQSPRPLSLRSARPFLSPQS